MATSANATINYSRDQLITAAYRLAGIWPSNQNAGDIQAAYDVQMATDFMNLELMELQAEGIVLSASIFTLQALVAGTATYTLPADTIDVQIGPNDEAGTIVPVLGSETPVQVMHRAEWLAQAEKANAGRPMSVYIARAAVVTATFWPVPDDSTEQWRYSRLRLLKDMDTGAVSVDLARRWLQYVTLAVAAHVALAKNLPLEKVNWLKSEAERVKQHCRGDDNERGKMRFVLHHGGKHW
jgi:hypothetical protein